MQTDAEWPRGGDARALESTERSRRTADLAVAAARGDDAAWKGLVEQFSGLIWSVTRAYRLGSADAADVFQTAWLRLAEHIGRLEHPEHVGAWLATTARRESLRAARASARVVPTDDDAVFDVREDAQASPEQAVLLSERAEQLWRAFRKLPARCQQLLRLLMATPAPSYAEVAAAIDRPVGSIGPTRARCLRLLREKLA
jgi:RNA polymerase sigma factor (sigma-70 family)